MKKCFLVILIILLAPMCSAAQVSGGYAQTLLFENFSALELGGIEKIFEIKGNDNGQSMSVTADPLAQNNKVMKVSNRLWGGSGSLWTQITFRQELLKNALGAKGKGHVAMDFKVMFDEEASYTTYFFGNAPSANNTYVHGLGRNGGEVFAQAGSYSSRRVNVTQELETSVWYEARMAYYFNTDNSSVYMRVYLRKAASESIVASTSWTKIQDFTFPDTNISEFSLLYNYMPKGMSNAGNTGSVYLDDIKIFTFDESSQPLVVAAHFENENAVTTSFIKNGERVQLGAFGIDFEGYNYDMTAVMALYSDLGEELMDVKIRTITSPEPYASTSCVLQWENEFITVPDNGAFIVKGLIWSSVNTMKSLCKPVVIRTRSAHPQIIITSSDVPKIKSLVQRDGRAEQWHNAIIALADEALSAPVFSYSSGSLLYTSRDMAKHMEYLGFAYLMTGYEKYAKKAWEQMEACAGFSSWNPSHFLDTAEMTYAMGIGYDWLYNYLDIQQRDVVATAIAEKGLAYGVRDYNSATRESTWPTRTNNWSAVCNGGLLIGALAIEEDDKQLSEYIVSNAVSTLKSRSIARYEKDGSYFEGPGYWAYSTKYLFNSIAALESTHGTDYGLSNYESLENTGFFGIYLNGYAGTFSYNDSGTEACAVAQLSYMAKIYNKPQMFNVRAELVEQPHPFDLIWYIEGDAAEVLPKDMAFYNFPLFVSRSGDFFSGSGIWTGIKGQKGTYDRMDLDCGSFMLDADGVRWALDLGSTSYNNAGYWDCSNNGTRYQYFKKRAEGHNTIVINPDENADQVAQCYAPIIAYGSTQEEAFAVVDMEPAYKNKVTSAKRGLKLFDCRGRVLVQDEIIMTAPSELYWFMHTKAEIAVGEDGKSAILTRGGKQLEARLFVDEDLQFSIMQEVGVSPGVVFDTSLQTTRRLAIHGENIQNLKLSVVFTPLESSQSLPQLPEEFTDLEMWIN